MLEICRSMNRFIRTDASSLRRVSSSSQLCARWREAGCTPSKLKGDSDSLLQPAARAARPTTTRKEREEVRLMVPTSCPVPDGAVADVFRSIRPCALLMVRPVKQAPDHELW